MQGSTHIAVGGATAILIMRPKSIPELLVGMGIASVGAVISDIDTGTSVSRRKADTILGYTAACIILLLVIEYVFKIGTFSVLFSIGNIARVVGAYMAALIICLYGKSKDHRTFMHSAIVMMALSCCFFMVMSSMAGYFVIAFASHLLLDALNYHGIQLLYPLPQRFCLNLCKSDGTANDILRIVGSGIIVASIIVCIVRNFV